MPDDRELMRLQVEALFTHDARGRMVGVNEPGGGVAPRFFLGRTARGNVWRFRHDLDEELVRQLDAACRSEKQPDGGRPPLAPDDSAAYERLLARFAPVRKRSAGPAFCFPRELPPAPDAVRVTEENARLLLQPPLDPWLADVALGRPMVAVVADGAAVSVCCSVRTTPAAHEAGVETAPAFRGRGHAARAAAGWAALVRGMGPIPLYSTSWENAASRAVARKLGLVQYGTDLHLT